MPKRKSLLMRKISDMLKTSIFVARMRKPIIPRLVSLKKTRKFKHYQLRYVHEYEYSPSSTPLIGFYQKPQKMKSLRKLYSIFLFSKCLNMLRDEREDGRWHLDMEALPCIENAVMARELSYSFHEDESVDEKAEKFIQRFYEEMRRQREDPFLQFNAMLDV